LQALQERGLELTGDQATFTVRPVKAFDKPAQAGGNFDLALFTVKTYDVESAAQALLPALGPQTAILTLQNGVDTPDIVGRIVGRERVLAGATTVNMRVDEPGRFVQVGPLRKVTLGELSGAMTSRVQAVAKAFEQAGFDVTVTSDAMRALWEKFVLLAPHATLTSSAQAPVGEIRATPEGAAAYRQLVHEVARVGRACGVTLPTDLEDRVIKVVMEQMSPMQKTSMSLDFERGRRVELEMLTGAVVRRGHELGVPTPGFDVLYAVLKVRALQFGGIASSAARPGVEPGTAIGASEPLLLG
jgi:2-dehydropantoate 2-reductase